MQSHYIESGWSTPITSRKFWWRARGWWVSLLQDPWVLSEKCTAAASYSYMLGLGDTRISVAATARQGCRHGAGTCFRLVCWAPLKGAWVVLESYQYVAWLYPRHVCIHVPRVKKVAGPRVHTRCGLYACKGVWTTMSACHRCFTEG